MSGHTQKFEIRLEGRILRTYVKGAWSAQTALKYEQALHNALADFPPQPFAHLLFFNSWELHTPDALPIIQRTVDWIVARGMVCSAEVFQSNALKEFLLNKIDREGSGQLEIRRFNDEPEAMRWLAEQGFVSVTRLEDTRQ